MTKPWLNGEPYYCQLCGAGGAEIFACEMPDCKMEDKATAEARAKRAARTPGTDKVKP